MNDTLAVRAAFDVQRSLAQASLSGSYQAIGMASAYPIRLLYILNDTNALVQFSVDAVHAAFVVQANGFILLDVCSDQSKSNGLFLPIGTTFYVKQIGTSSSGTGIYITLLYGANL
jgi:hypothetical protein